MQDDQNTRSGFLFLCVANSARSQLAEGWGRAMAPQGVDIYSAGSHPGTLNPIAVRVMEEVGIDLTQHHSKSVDEIALDRIGTVITLCAEEVCPLLPGNVKRLHWPFRDPATATGSEEETLAAFRTARNGIEKRVRELFRETA
jgi:arsenate reductase